MSLFEKYSVKNDEYVFVNFIEKQFQVKQFSSLISTEYTNKFVIEFKPTDKCNFDCSYCCFHDNKSKPLSEEQFTRYLEILKNINIKQKEIFLFVYGGEPTKHPKLVEWIIRLNQLFPDKRVKTLIQSNGLFWSLEDYKNNCEQLSKHHLDYVFSFSFHKEFAKLSEIVSRIKYLLSINKFEVLTYMITKKHIEDHIRIIKILQEAKIPLYVRTILQESEWFLTSKYKKYITVNTNTPYVLTDETGVHYFSFEDLTMRGYLNFKGYNCSAGQNAILLASTGKIYRCDMDFLYDRDPMYDVNISLEPLYDINKCLTCKHKFCSIYYGDKWDAKATTVSH